MISKLNNLNTYQQKIDDFRILEKEIVARIDYIIKTIASVFSKELKSWSFYGSTGSWNSPSHVSLYHNTWSNIRIQDLLIQKEHLTFQPKLYGSIILDKYGKKLNLSESFPMRWLQEDFEKELLKGKEYYEGGGRSKSCDFDLNLL